MPHSNSGTLLQSASALSSSGLENHQQESQPQHTDPILSALSSSPSGPFAAESQNIDIFHPLFDPAMLELFPNGELPDLALLETSPLNLDYLDITEWNNTAVIAGEPVDANMAMPGWNTMQ